MLRLLPASRSLILPLGLLAACSDDDGDYCGACEPPNGPPVTTYVTFERDTTVSSIAIGNEGFASDLSITNEGDGGLVFDYAGNAYQPNLADTLPILRAPGIHVLWRMRQRSIAGGTGLYTRVFDRAIEGFTTTIVEPRAIALAHGAGLLFATDTGDSSVKAWTTSASGDMPPLFSVVTPAAPWGIAYDESNDRLFVSLVDASVVVYDDWATAQPMTPARQFQLTEDGATTVGSSFRGLIHLTENGVDRLLIADIGPTEGAARDGAIWQIDDASTADGLAQVIASIPGSQRGLGDPVDLSLDEFHGLRVADSGRNVAISFAPGFTPTNGQVPRVPSVRARRSFPRASGVAVTPVNPTMTFVSTTDVDDPTIPIAELVLSVAPAGMNGSLLRYAADLTGAATATFDLGQQVAAVLVDGFGDAYAGFTDGMNGGIAVVHRFVQERGVGAALAFDSARDRTLTSDPGLFGFDPVPENVVGLDIDEEVGLAFLADSGDEPSVWVYGLEVGGEGLTFAQLKEGFDATIGLPRALDYDPRTDTLYVALSTGVVYAYDQFFASPGEMPDRIITPGNSVGSTQVSTDLAAIVHDAERDLLILADVGDSAGVSNDGRLFVIEGASMADGLTAVSRTVEGAATQLDEPLDLAWNGATLWVAEHQNGLVLRFDDFEMAMGAVAPSASAAVPDVRSVDLILTGLAPTEGGSIDRD